MAVEFPCSQCQAELRIELKDVGKKARCPRCGMIHQVPDEAIEANAESIRTESIDQKTTIYRAAARTGESLDSARTQWSMKTPDGSVYGPVDRSELDSWAAEGRLSSQCLVRVEGNTHWQSAISTYPELAGLPAARNDQVASSVSTSRSRLDSSRVSVGIYQRTNRGLVILLFAIFGLLFSAFPPFNIVAFAWARREKAAIERGHVNPNNRGWLDFSQAVSIFGMCVSGILVLGLMFS